MRSLTLLMGMTCLVMACSKPVSDEEKAAKQKSADFLASVQQHKYKLVAFYSDKPIDYITSDSEVRAETDLWSYVKPHVIDDDNFFGANGALTVYQNAEKFPGNDNEQINAGYSISPKGVDVACGFVDYLYMPLEYKLQEFDNAYFTLYIDGPSGSKLYSKFARVE